ncbi:hypothetical protein [Nocardia aurea]|uniref:hypothetical protein n=1 Tax=Nocardia aurea TaxID=2144174 RepID=UPI0018E5393B|nr:hypothetical protein [Nocardia aurea]
MTDFVAQDNSARSVRSYAYSLLRWWRWLNAVDVQWDRATPAEGRDLVLWLGIHLKPRNSARTASRTTAGTVNPITGKRNLDDHYAARTIRHSNAVVRAFYEFWIEIGQGPLINPMPLRGGRQRANAHHNPTCSLLRPDPTRRARLEEIHDNLEARIIEAKREGWLGEVEGLQVSYAGVKDKLAQIDATPRQTATGTELGIPTFRSISGRASTL